jgi:pimeloyl-ACP methyl ester carboxylesterase
VIRCTQAARFRWSESGAAPGARTLLCLHGYPDTLRVFEPLQSALAATHADTLRVVAIDWPGQGGSPASHTQPLHSPAERAAWLLGAMRELALTRVSLYAHDMGSLPALLLAASAEAQIEHVFVSNALLRDGLPVSPEIRAMRTSRLYRIALPLAPGLVFERCMQTFFGGSKGRAQLLWESEMKAHFVRSGRNVARTCTAYDRALRRSALPQVNVPIHVLWGTDGMHFDEAHGQWLARTQKRASFTRIAGGGHWMVVTHAAQIAAWVASTLKA